LRGLPWDSNTFGGILSARNWGRMVSICCITGVLGVLPDLGCHGGSRSSAGMGMIAWIRRWAGCLYSISNSFSFSALESSNRELIPCTVQNTTVSRGTNSIWVHYNQRKTGQCKICTVFAFLCRPKLRPNAQVRINYSLYWCSIGSSGSNSSTSRTMQRFSGGRTSPLKRKVP